MITISYETRHMHNFFEKVSEDELKIENIKEISSLPHNLTPIEEPWLVFNSKDP